MVFVDPNNPGCSHHVILSITRHLRRGRSGNRSLRSVWRLIPHPGSAHRVQWVVGRAAKLGQVHWAVKELHHECMMESSAWIFRFSFSLPDCLCGATEGWTICSRWSFQRAWETAGQRLRLRLRFLILIFPDRLLQSAYEGPIVNIWCTVLFLEVYLLGWKPSSTIIFKVSIIDKTWEQISGGVLYPLRLSNFQWRAVEAVGWDKEQS